MDMRNLLRVVTHLHYTSSQYQIFATLGYLLVYDVPLLGPSRALDSSNHVGCPVLLYIFPVDRVTWVIWPKRYNCF